MAWPRPSVGTVNSSLDLDLLRGESVLVTGGTGFLGARLVRHLVEAGGRVSVVSRGPLTTGRLADVADRVTVLRSDLRSLAAKPPPDWPVPKRVFHLGARGVDPAAEDLAELIAVNVTATARLLDYADEWQVERFVQFGTCGEYGSCQLAAEDAPLEPRSAYGATKAAATLLAQIAARIRSLPVAVLRPFSVYGPGENPHRIVSAIALRAMVGQAIPFTEGRQTRDFVYVDDVVDAALRAAVMPVDPGAVFNVCTGIETSLRDLVQAVIREVGVPVEVQFGSVPPHPAEMWHNCGNPARARESLNWSARVPLDEGLRRTVAWLRQMVTGRGGVP